LTSADGRDMILGMEKLKVAKPIPVAVRREAYDRLVRYRSETRPAPTIVEIVTAAVDEWIDRQELARRLAEVDGQTD